jgi:glutathione synthase/RimK-type ligase-like ATP-grasp enzyme
MKKLPHIGTIELVSLPSDKIQGIPAKIDTGADNSAIWASHITEKDNRLSFVLFDKTSPFYTGRVLTTRDHEVISVKNSFGKSELRYKVSLTVTVAGKTIKARFTLANRKSNKYSILIGRRTIQGKFLVDVARKPATRPSEVLVLATKRNGITEKFAKNLAQQSENLKVTCVAYEDLLFTASNQDNHIVIRKNGRDLASFDIVHFKTTFREIAAVIAHYLQERRVPFLDQATRHLLTPNKLYQYMQMADNKIPVPTTIFMLPSYLEKSYNRLHKQLGMPFVLKDINGRKGHHNYLVTDERSFQKACRQATQDNIMYLAQAYIPNDEDCRALVFGNKIALVIRRSGDRQKTHLNNTSRGGTASLVPIETLPPKVQTMCLAAAQLFERQVAGVDIVQDKTNNLWYCLEVNDGPQLATGSFVDEKQAAFVAYLERKLAK